MVFAKSFSRVRLGSGTHKCAHCLRTFPDGSVEWPTVSGAARAEYLFPAVLRAYICVALVIAGLNSLRELPNWRDVWAIAILGCSLCMIPLMAYWVSRALEIQRSVARFEKQALAEAGYGGSLGAQPR
jgi:hypothetical protein